MEETHKLVTRMKTLLSPVRLVPPEIWREIFLAYFYSDNYEEPSPMDPPLLLCQICRGWRELAILTPELWGSISIRKYARGCHPSKDLLDLWLSRSDSDYPLHIYFGLDLYMPEIPAHKQEDPTKDVKSVIETLLRYHRRWRDVNLSLSDFTDISALLQHSHEPSLLENVTFTLSTSVDDFQFDANIDVAICGLWRNAPRLRYFALECRGLQFRKSFWMDALHLPRGQLTTIKLLNPLFVDDCFRTLGECGALESCHFTISGSHRRQQTHAILPVLHTLSVELVAEDDHTTIFEILSNITTPALRNLTLSFETRWSQPLFSAFLSRSTCSIEQLALRLVVIREDNLRECLGLMSSSLTALTIQGFSDEETPPPVTAKVLQLLSITSSPPIAPLCPRLKEINLDDEALDEGDDGAFAAMVESRWHLRSSQARQFSRIEKVSLSVRSEETFLEDVGRLQDLCDEGLCFNLHFRRTRAAGTVWHEPRRTS